MIDFPCPKSITSMTPVEGGYHCNYCNKKVRDVSELSWNQLITWKAENAGQCVIITQPKRSKARFSLAHFALALMIVSGGAFFNFGNAQVKEHITNVKGELNIPQDPSLGILKVNLKNQFDHHVSGRAWLELPNGKEIELYEAEEGVFYVEIPAYCKGKTIYVFAEHLDKKKHISTAMYQFSEELEVDFVFKSHRMYRTIVVGSF